MQWRKPARGEPSEGGSDLGAQCGGIDFTQQAAVQRGSIHGFLASKHAEIGAFLELRPDAGRLLGGIQHQDAQRDSGGSKLLAEGKEDHGQ